MLQEELHAEVVQCRAEEHRTELSRTYLFQVKVEARTVQKLHLLGQRFPGIGADQAVQLFGVGNVAVNGGEPVTPAVGIPECENAVSVPVVDALEIHAAADGPVHRIGADAELLFQLIQQIKRIARLVVQLVDKGKNRNMPHGADAEQLAGLRLNALCRVNDHHRAVRRHQGTVGVLREILMPGGIQDIDAVALVLELHDRRSDGNASFLLHLHPVGYGVAVGCLALDRAGGLNGAAVEQEFFGQCGLARIRVGNDGERPPPVDLFT